MKRALLSKLPVAVRQSCQLSPAFSKLCINKQQPAEGGRGTTILSSVATKPRSQECAQKMTNGLIILLVLFGLQFHKIFSSDCDNYFQNGLGNILNVDTGSKFEPLLGRGEWT